MSRVAALRLPFRPTFGRTTLAAALVATAAALSPAAATDAAANIVPAGRGHVIDLNLRCSPRMNLIASYTYSRHGPGAHRLITGRWIVYADGRRVRSSAIRMPSTRTRGAFRVFRVQRFASRSGYRCRVVVRFSGASHVRRAGNCLIGVRTNRIYPRSHAQLRLCFRRG